MEACYVIGKFVSPVLSGHRWIRLSAWQLYGIRRPEISAFRAPFLLRTLVVDSQPFQNTLKKVFNAEGDWELRFLIIPLLCATT